MMVLFLASVVDEVRSPIVREAPFATGPIVPWLVIVLRGPVTTQGAVCTPLSVMVWFDTEMLGQAKAGADGAPAIHAATPADASRPARAKAPSEARLRTLPKAPQERSEDGVGICPGAVCGAGGSTRRPLTR
jgi:hypothetical protein